MISFRVILQGTKIQLDGLLHTIYKKENDLGGAQNPTEITIFPKFLIFEMSIVLITYV